ncbi:MAG: lipopolysaccharide biosynthesis protein [Odoribacter sp.]|nr:lipopolysaccharide biosynthesis protein [Odoribacter sp.]
MEPKEINTENEIDLIEVIRKLWKKRRFIWKMIGGFLVVGILVALFSAREYTSTCIMVPQTGEKMSGGSLNGLAALAGINLSNMGNNEVLSPKIYPKVLASVPFQKELMNTPIEFQEYDQPVTLLDYYTNEEYRRFSLGGSILKYTIGLPGILMKAIRGKKVEPEISLTSGIVVETVSKEEDECIRRLQSKVTLNVNEKEGYVTLSANMPEAVAAAQLAARVQALLQKYITEFKIEKAQANLEFVEERCKEAREQFELKQEELARLRDANQNIASAWAQTAEERLSNEYNVALSVYSELAKQREQANIQVKENTPVFTIIEPVTVPNKPSKPKRMLIVVAFVFLGAFAGVGLVLVLPFVAQVSGSKRLKNWLPEEETGKN